MSDHSSSFTSPSPLLYLINSLPLSSLSIPGLLSSHKPLVRPSQLTQQPLNKFLNRLNSALLSKHADGGAERRAACEIARLVVEQDEEGYVVMQWGKGWVGTCLSAVSSPSTPLRTIQPHLALLSTLNLTSPHYPSFERETIHPILGKLSVSLSKLLARCALESRPDWLIMLHVLEFTRTLLIHWPSPFRPLVPVFRPLSLSLILHLALPSSAPSSSTASSSYAVPHEVRQAATDLLASLHVTNGKAQSPAAWSADMKEALGGLAMAMHGIAADAWLEDPVRVPPSPAPLELPPLPTDSSLRLPMALEMMEGWVEVVLGLLRFPVSRPVPVPIALIVAAGLRCLNLTLDTPTVAHISPQHHAALLAALPRIWTVGTLLLGGVATACGDHLFPHLRNIFDHAIWLSELIPGSMTGPQKQLLRFHHLMLTLYPPALLPIDYPSRLLRLCLGKLSPLLEPRPQPSAGPIVNGGGKRGKKRARGAEDGLVGGLEGRDSKSLGDEEIEVVLESLRLTPLLHPTPLLSPELLRLSIRLHLSLHLSFPSLPSYDSRLADAVAHVLEDALLMNDSQSGTAYGWKSLILSVLETPGDKVSLVLHPSLPPMVRPQPPLSALHFFAPENEEEKRIRLEMGFGTGQDGNGGVMNEMEVDGNPEREEPVINGQGTGIFDNGLNYGSTSVEQREIPGRDEGDHMAAQAGLLVAVGEVPAPTATVTQNITSPRPDNTSTRDEPAVPAEAGGGDTVPFVSTPLDKGKSKLVEPEIRRGRLSDSPIPELDSGSSDFGDMEDDDEDEEDDEG